MVVVGVGWGPGNDRIDEVGKEGSLPPPGLPLVGPGRSLTPVSVRYLLGSRPIRVGVGLGTGVWLRRRHETGSS